MENKEKKVHFLLKALAGIVVFSGIMLYAGNFPATMDLLDKAVNNIFAFSGTNLSCSVFSDFSEFSKEAEEKIVYWAEIIKNNFEGTFEGIKPLPDFLISCAAVFPAEGETVTSNFGKRVNPISGKNENHKGIDIAAAFGSKVKAAWPGTVLKTGFDEIYGNYVIIEHSDGFFTKYCHLSKICTEENSFVKAEEKIGEAGSTGWSTGSHLHFEVSIGGVNIDPKECFAT